MSAVACVGDLHVCPGMNGPTPHVGGPVLPRPGSVFAGKRPVACVGDVCGCVGAPDAIASGSKSVFAEGRPIANGLSSTSHGGTITAVCLDVHVG